MAGSDPWSAGPPTAESGSPVTDHGSPAAVLISATELEDLEDALALAQSELRQAAGQTVRIPHDQVRAQLGLGEE